MIQLSDVLYLHNSSIRDYGGLPGIRDMNLVISAVERPFQTFDQLELYASVFDKAAALFESIIKNHPFLDGNKRTAFLSAFVLLYRNGFMFIASNDEAYDFVMSAASSSVSFFEISHWFKDHSKTI